MKNSRMIHKLDTTLTARCKYWLACGVENCDHYSPHRPDRERCKRYSPVRYCSVARGFVYDVPLADTNPEYDCDPNLAFKAHKHAAKIDEKNRSKYYEERETDDFF